MAEKKKPIKKRGFFARAVDFWRHRSRATRLDLLALTLLFLCLEFIVPWILSSHYSKRFFEKHLSDSLHYPVTFDRMNTHLSLRPMVVVSGFGIRDHQGIPFFQADEARMELSPWSLVRWRIVLRRVYIQDGEFLAARLPNGHWNVADLIEAQNDPDQAIDLSRASVELKNIRLAFHDRALPMAFSERIRLRTLSISNLDLHRRTRLSVNASIEDQFDSTITSWGDFQFSQPEDPSTLEGKLVLNLRHFNLQTLNPYLKAVHFPVTRWDGAYDLELDMERQGTASVVVALRTQVDQLKMVLAAAPQEELNLGKVALEGQASLTHDELRFEKMIGTMGSTRFEATGKCLQYRSKTATVEASLSTSPFELAEPIRSILRLGSDESHRRLLDGVSGILQAQLKWSGPVQQLTQEWRVDLKNVQFQNATYAFRLKDVSGTIRATAAQTQIESLRGRFLNAPLQGSGAWDASGRVDLNLSFAGLSLGQVHPYIKNLHERGFIQAAAWINRLQNLEGVVQGNLHLAGFVQDPVVNGALTVGGARAQLAGVSAKLSDVQGRVVLEGGTIQARNVSGNFGGSIFELAATLDRKNLSILELQLQSPEMDLRRVDELMAARWIDPIEVPHLGQLREADGTAKVNLNYQRSSQGEASTSMEGGKQIPDIALQLHRANASFSKLPLPLKNLNGGFTRTGESWFFDRLEGQLGDSSLLIHGSIDQVSRFDEKWNVRVEAIAVLPQLALVFPGGIQDAWVARGRFPLNVSFNGQRLEGVRVQASVDFPKNSEWELAKRVGKPAETTGRLSWNGIWKDHWFQVNDGAFVLGDLPLSIKGTVNFPPASNADVDLSFSLNQFVPVNQILNGVKLPTSEVRVSSGSLSGTVNVRGKLESPRVHSMLRVADLSLEGMPWGMTSLTGDLTAGNEGISAKDFLAIVNNVPMRITGDLNLGGPQGSLKAQVENMNLDALVAALSRMPTTSSTATSARFGKPLSIDLQAAGGRFFHAPIQRFLARGLWKEGVLQLDPVHVDAGGSTSQARLEWNTVANSQQFTFNAQKVSMSAFLDEVLDLQIPVDANLNVQANLKSHSPDPKAPLSSLEGTVHFEAMNGILEHAGLPQRLLSMAVLVHEGLFGFNLGRIFQTIDPPKFKSFNSWSADVVFSPHGNARLEHSEFKSDLFDLAATGTVDSKTEDIMIVVKGSLPEIPRGSNFLAQIFGRISIKEFLRDIRDFGYVMAGQRKRIKPRRHHFEFKLTGNLEGIKSIEDFKFTN